MFANHDKKPKSDGVDAPVRRSSQGTLGREGIYPICSTFIDSSHHHQRRFLNNGLPTDENLMSDANVTRAISASK